MKNLLSLFALFICCTGVSAQPGQLDASFGTNGIVTDNFPLFGFKTIAAQKDGKIVGAGWNILARYNTNGNPDTLFGSNGKDTTDILINVLLIQNDGKILIAGTGTQSVDHGFVIERYNSNGSLDLSFGNEGKQITNFGTAYADPNSIAIQPNEKIVVTGMVSSVIESSFVTDFAIARYNTDGSLDDSFSNDGKVTKAFGFNREDYKCLAAIQSDGKIVVGGGNFTVLRFNSDGSPDNTFNGDGIASVDFSDENNVATAMAIQQDGKIVIAGSNFNIETLEFKNFIVARLKTDGAPDSAFGNAGKQATSFGNFGEFLFSMVVQADGKIVTGGLVSDQNGVHTIALARYDTSGNLDNTFGSEGKQTTELTGNNTQVNALAISENKLYAAGPTNAGGFIARYLLDSSGTPPIVSITTPADNAYFIEGTYIKFKATASDTDGTISKVEFYNGNTLLHTEYVAPYGYQFKNAAAGNYTITARATDNNGQVGISAPVHITVVSKNDFNISIVSPVTNEVYAAPAYVHLKAEVNNPHGKIVRVEFYNGTTLLRNEYKYPYTYVWRNVPEGVYNITAKAIDEQGFVTTSETITIKVISREIITSSKPYKENEKTALKDAFHLRLSPNPATNIVTIQTSGLQLDKPATLSIISISGNVLKNIQISNASTSLDVSTLTSGVYTIKITSGNKVSYKQFVKL